MCFEMVQNMAKRKIIKYFVCVPFFRLGEEKGGVGAVQYFLPKTQHLAPLATCDHSTAQVPLLHGSHSPSKIR